MSTLRDDTFSRDPVQQQRAWGMLPGGMATWMAPTVIGVPPGYRFIQGHEYDAPCGSCGERLRLRAYQSAEPTEQRVGIETALDIHCATCGRVYHLRMEW